MAAVAASAAGEDLELRGAVSPAVLAGAERNLSTMAGWWGWRVPRITAERAEPAVAEPDRGTGLFFTRGIDSWSSLLTLQAEGTGPTHLLTIRDIELPRDADTHAEVLAETQRVAAQARPAARGAVDRRPRAARSASRTGPAPTARCWPGSHCSSARCWPASTSPAPTVRSRAASGAATPTSSPIGAARRRSSCTTRPSWTARRRPRSSHGRSRPSTPCSCAGRAARARNCGRCPKCLRTMTALDLVRCARALSHLRRAAHGRGGPSRQPAGHAGVRAGDPRPPAAG